MNWRIRLRVHYTRRSDLLVLPIVALLALALLVSLAWGPGSVAASARQPARDPAPAVAPTASASLRRYYLTTDLSNGNGTRGACARGYHFASLWEILDTSNLKYNTVLGVTRSDSGQGPPAYHGWVRTGYASDDDGVPGLGNCEGWTSHLPGDVGTYVYLPSDWTAGYEDFLGWAIATAICSSQQGVWCVEDASHSVYLPVVLRGHSGTP